MPAAAHRASDDMQETLTALKNDGNARFAAGDAAGAVAAYQRGIDVIERAAADALPQPSIGDEVRALHVLLYSNMANAYLSLGQFAASWQAAAAATRVDPAAWKPWLRYIEARRRGGFPFDALVHSLRYLRPLLRLEREQRRLSAAEVAATLSAVEEPLCDELGVLRLSTDIELVEYAGGVAMVSRCLFQPRDVVFIERKYTRTNFEEGGLSQQPDLTTETIVRYFADRLRPEQAAASPRWLDFKKDFSGAWPRSDGDIDADTRDTIGTYLRTRFPDVPDGEFRELLSTALMCRYNCFHSGFFRTCALANHSCHANIAMKYSPAEETVKMIAVDVIQPGELMNVKYLSDAHFVLGVGKRRELLRSWLFWCSCDRCQRDIQLSAIAEFVECPRCGAFTHAALVGLLAVADPLLRAAEPCRGCGVPVEWTTAQRDLLQKELMHTFTTSTSHYTAESLAAWMEGQLAQTEKLRLHPENWIYRALFYFLTVALTALVSDACAGLNESRISQSGLDAIRTLYRPCGLQSHYQPRCDAARERAGAASALVGAVARDELVSTASESGGGSEFLKCFVILWELLAPFYPVHEMWSVHDAMCKLVLMHLLYPTPAVSLTPALALQLLQRHGRYIGEISGAKWVHSYSMHKTTFNSKEPLPLAKIKKAFKGS